jgi:hypothetical protein
MAKNDSEKLTTKFGIASHYLGKIQIVLVSGAMIIIDTTDFIFTITAADEDAAAATSTAK